MAEKSIDEKPRRLASQRPENGKEFQQLQGAQNQLLEIQAAQKQNLMEQRLMSGAQAEQNQILAQAAEVGAQSVAGNMQLNQATAGVMGRYGLNQPRTSSQVKQQHRESVTRQNVTIHNNTTNITNNTVPANIGGPIQGRPIQFQQPQASGDGAGGMGKFKNWLNQTFARQEEAAKRRDREYQRREVSLTKSANKMMRKIEEFGKDITKKLDPRNVGRTVGGQLKTILKLIGIGVIAKNFDRILDWIYGAQDKVEHEYIPNIKNFFSWIKGEEGAQKPGLVTRLQEGLEKTFGKLLFGNDGDSSRFKDKGLIKGIGEYFWNDSSGEDRGILNRAWDKIKEEFKDRSEKAKNAITLGKSANWANIVTNPGEALKEFFTNLTNYLGVLIAGDAYLGRIQNDVISRSAANESRLADGYGKGYYKKNETVRDEMGNSYRVYSGDAALLRFKNNLRSNGGYYFDSSQYTIPQEYIDQNGKIKTGSIGANLAVSNNITYHAQAAEDKGRINTAALSNDFSHLYSEAKKGPILVNKNILNVAEKKNPGLIERLEFDDHIVDVKDNDWLLVLRERPEEDIERDVRSVTPRWKQITDYLKSHGLNGAANVYASMRDAAGLRTLISEGYIKIKLERIPLYTQEIIRREDLKSSDIVIKRISAQELKNLGYSLLDQEAIRQAAYGYLSSEDRKTFGAEDISFNLSDKDTYVHLLQRGLEEISTRPKIKNTYDYNSENMVHVPMRFREEEPTEIIPESPKESSSEISPFIDKDATEGGFYGNGPMWTSFNGELTTASTNTVQQNSDENKNSNISEAQNAVEVTDEMTGWSQEGLGVNNNQVFDVRNAVEYLQGHAKPGSTGYCAKHVREAMQAGGLNVNDRPGYGGGYAEYLPKKGWREIPNNSRLLPGDVLVTLPFTGSNGVSHKYGHIAMWTGTNWISDFVQNSRDVYKHSGGTPEKMMKLFRFGGPKPEIDPNYRPSTSVGEYYKLTSSDTDWQDIDGLWEKSKTSLREFFSGAKEVVSNAIMGLSHKASDAAGWVMDKAGDGVDWETSLHNGVSTYEPYKKSNAEQYLYARYTGKDNGTYTIPSSISSGSTLKRDEWWAKFFDSEGNLKISKEDNVNPALMRKLENIEVELVKGNKMSELDLKMAAQGLDAEMVHNAAETRDQKRLINALVATGNSGNKDRVQLFSDSNT